MELLQTTTEPLVSRRIAPAAKAVVARAALVAAALLSVIVGLGVLESLGVEHSAPLPARHRVAARSGLASLPVAAQGAVSAALGADSPAYRIRPSGGELQAQSTPQRLHIRFGSSGVSLSSGATHVGLSLRAFGYGSSLPALGAVTPRVHGNRATYARPGISEWYVNGPLGLEQGFTIAAPSGHQAGALALQLALSGNARAALGWGGQSISLTSAAGPALRYSGVRASDARGRLLHSWLQLSAGRLELRVDTRGARYPVRIDPFVQQGEKLTGGGESGKGFFGFSVALSPDGNTALIGGPSDSTEVGAAWVFTRTGSTWSQQAKLTGASEIGNADFGFSVALATKEGNTAIIGGPFDNSEVGAAWVFTRTGSTWSQQAKLTGSGESGKGFFGSSVALASTEGNTALIGADRDNTKVGAAWVFTRSVSTWSQQAELTGSGESGQGEFGSDVALSAEGNTALIGGLGDSSFVGAAWVFTGSGSSWTQQAKLTGSGGSGATRLGAAVALSSEGNTALIGGPGDNLLVGAAWVFTRSGSTWTQQAELTGSGESGKGEFGTGVALSAAGNTAVIGGPEDNTRIGAAWFFTRSGSTWSQQGTKRTGSGETGTGEFANSVALSSEGNTALSGGSGDNSEAGAAWVFVFVTPLPPTVVTTAASSVNQTRATLNATVNPNGGEVSQCKFEYGTSPSYGSSAPCTPAQLGQGESPVAVSAAITGLSPNTTYHFRISATNAGGTSKGSDATFKTLANVGTPPTAVTGLASAVGSARATLNATVNPNGGEVYECKLEYGTSISYGASAPCTPSPGSGSSPVAVSATITGLSPNTTYHFRIFAANPGGTSNGADETFKTHLVTAPTVLTAAGSSVTQTSATLNATVNPNEGEVGECKFEYGTSISYGASAPCSSLPGPGTSPASVSAAITGLTNKTTYHFRISATNAGGTSKGSDQTFTAASAHVYKNGIIGAEGKIVRTIGWGTLKLTNESFGEVECHTISAGSMENPTGGGSAIGKAQVFAPYECVSASCKAAGGTAIELTPENLPWSTEATEVEGGAFRMRTGNRIKATGAVFLRVNCVGVKNTQFFAENVPKVLNNGISIGTAPDEEEFDQPGSGELESEALGGLKFAGKVKFEGYGQQELIELKNP